MQGRGDNARPNKGQFDEFGCFVASFWNAPSRSIIARFQVSVTSEKKRATPPNPVHSCLM